MSSAKQRARFGELETATGSGRLAKIEQYSPSWMLFTRFNYITADAAGQKLTGKATQAACRWIVGHYQLGERSLVRTTIDPGLGSAV